MTRPLRRDSAFGFVAICGFLTGMAVMAVLTLLFGGEPYVPAVALGARARPDGGRRAAAVVRRTPAPRLDEPTPGPDVRSRTWRWPNRRRRRAIRPISTTRSRRCGGAASTLPIATIERATLRSNFDEQRGGTRRHEAIDLLAPRHTPVVAVEDGIIARLFNSKAGGITVYQFDPTTSYAYYYAHLERYADGLEEGATVTRGQVLGYVGTSGNAPAEHAAPALCDLRPRRRQALVGGHAGRSVRGLAVARRAGGAPSYALCSPSPRCRARHLHT